MIAGLDHVVVLVRELEAGVAAYQTLFARAPAWRSIGDGAETVLFTLDNMTLELVSPVGNGATADRIRTALAEQGEGLASICFRTNDIAKMRRRLDRLTLKPDRSRRPKAAMRCRARRCHGSEPAHRPKPPAVSGCSFLRW
jgi:catechol 2,3-dioxygenase-like lactoylglutathione lyase family enzyme